MAVDVQLEDDIRKIEGLVAGYLRSPQDEATRQALSAELDKLDDQTARADAYGNFRSVLVRYQVPRSWVIGATSDTSTAEDVPSAEFKAQVALVKAAKNAIRGTTAEAQSALQRAHDELAEIRRREAGDDHGKRDGDQPGRPRRPNAAAKSSSASQWPTRPRTWTASGRGRLPGHFAAIAARSADPAPARRQGAART